MGKTLSVRVCRRVAAIVAVVVAVAVPVAGQSTPPRPKASSSSTVSRTADGHPDLQGVWLFATLTPLQRPDNLAGRTHLTDEEIAAIEERAGSRKETFGLFPDDANYSFDKRTSLIVDPADGKVPPMTPAGQKRQDVRSAARTSRRKPRGPSHLRAVYRRVQRRAPDHPWRVQPAHPAGPDARLRRDACRDGSRGSHHPARRTSTSAYPASCSGTEARAGDGKVTRS